MLSGYTVFTTYILVPESIGLGYGYSKSVHCNYIKSLQLTTSEPSQMEVVISFPTNTNDFKFLSDDINNGTGFTAQKIYAVVQLVPNSGFTTMNSVKPSPSEWKKYDLTSQITGHVSGNTITSIELTQQAFKIPLLNYQDSNIFPAYNLHDYITYPTKQANADSQLCFGDETFFLGNVATDIKAVAYTLDIPIQLDFNEFNSSTNLTWNSETDKVYISEIGIYDADKNLVAIGKLNNPIEKDASISRTIVFAVDF